MTVRVEHVSKQMRGAEVLSDVSIEVPDGMVAGLSGVNGSGKTMLMQAVCGLIRPTSGRVLVDGAEVRAGKGFPARLGMLIEGPAFLDTETGFENLRLLASIRREIDDEDVARAMEVVGLNPSEPKRYRAYSLGMKQRLGIAAAIMERPHLLVLDEPTNALDASGVTMLKSVVGRMRADGAAVLISCHDASILRELADTIYHMEAGRIVRVEERVTGEGEVRHA